MTKLYRSFCLLLTTYSILSFSCCGYSTRSLLPDYIQKVYIKIFENTTVKTGLDEIATQATIEAFRTGSDLKITDERQADIVIEGQIVNYNKEPYVYTGALSVSQYKVTITFHVRCLDQAKNGVFWEGDVSEWALFETDENQGINEATKKTAQKLVTTILTNW